jgi:DnaJ-class molecular chaperone
MLFAAFVGCSENLDLPAAVSESIGVLDPSKREKNMQVCKRCGGSGKLLRTLMGAWIRCPKCHGSGKRLTSL